MKSSRPAIGENRRYRYFVRIMLLGSVVALLAGCGSHAASPPVQSDVAGTEKTASKEKSRCVEGSVRAVGTSQRSFAAVVTTRATAYRAPSRGPFARFGRLNVNGVPTVFGVLAKRVDRRCAAMWYRVQLPLKPNGVAGWVRARDVAVGTVDTRIEVDLSRRLVTLFRRGKPVLRTTAAIGSGATPTPIGRFYVNQRLVPTDTGGPFGPGAIGISAFSNVLTGWAQGGPVAIHGTNEPWSIGHAVSNGCIRLPNKTLLKVFNETPAGTPVIIRP